MSTLAVTTVQSVNTSTNLTIYTANAGGGSKILLDTNGGAEVKSNRNYGWANLTYDESYFGLIGAADEFPYLDVCAYGAQTTGEYALVNLTKKRGTYTGGTTTFSNTIDGDYLGEISFTGHNSAAGAGQFGVGCTIDCLQTGSAAANGWLSSTLKFYIAETSTGSFKNMMNINTTAVSVASTNTFNLGTASIGGSGYTYLPNGLKMIYGVVTPNSIGQNTVTFPSGFPISIVSVNLTPRTTANASVSLSYRSSTVGNTGLTIYCVNSTSVGTNTNVDGVSYMCLGY